MEPRRSHRCIIAMTIAAVLVGLLILTGQADYAGAQAGTWNGSWTSEFGGSGAIHAQISESGSSISGTMNLANTDAGNLNGLSLTGTIQGDVVNFNASYKNSDLSCSLEFTQGILQCKTIQGSYAVSCNNGYFDAGSFSISGGLWLNAKASGNGWYWLNWFDYFNADFSPWVYHQTLGWLYPVGASTNNIWFWDPQWDGHGGWWWTSSSFFPWVYSATEKEWLCYDADATGARWFFTSGGQASTH